MENKKILIVAPSDYHIESFHIPYIRKLKEEGYIVDVATNTNKKIEYSDKTIRMVFNKKAIKRLKDIMIKEKYDVISCHTEKVSIITRIAYKLSNLKNTKLIYVTHGFSFYKGAPIKKWLYFIFEKILAKYTTTLVTMNMEDYEIAKKCLKTDIKYIKGIGLNKDKYQLILTDDEKKKIRKELNLKETDFVMLYPSELNERKNQKLLIEIMPYLDKKVKLLLPGNDKLKGKYQKLIKKLNLEDRVYLLGYRCDIDKLIQISDLELSSSKSEGLPINIVEAMYMKIPIVATNCKGNRDLIKNDINGYLVEVNNKEDLIDKITFLYKNKKFRKNLGCNSEQYIKEYLLEQVMDEFIKLYQFDK